MKALFVGNTSWSMWNFRVDVMTSFKNAGWEVSVVAPFDETSQKLIDKGFKYIPVNQLNRKGKNPFKDIMLFFELCKIYKIEKPDLIFHYTIKPNIWGSLAAAALRYVFLSSAKTIAMVSGLGYVFIKKTWLTSIAAMLYRVALIFAHKVIFLNEDDMNDFFRLRILKPDQDKAVLMHGEGVDTDYFKPASIGNFSEVFTFLFVGRLLVDKGIREFVEAARIVKRRHPQSSFQILGNIDEGNSAAITKQELDSWVNEGTISYLGCKQDVRPFFAKATAIVLPSYLEGFSRVLLEALSMGKPIITSDVRGCKELVDSGRNGFLVEPRNSDSLAHAFISFLALDRFNIAAMCDCSRNKSKQYSVCNAISFYWELTTAVIGTKK